MNNRQRVYDYYRAYIADHAYAPTLTEAALALDVCAATVRKAVLWLADHQFLQRSPGTWRGVQMQIKHCACGVEITPDNAVMGRAGKRFYLRGSCSTCWTKDRKVVRWRASQMKGKAA